MDSKADIIPDVVPTFEGYLEYISAERVAGWVRRIGDQKPIAVQVIYKGVVLGHVTADVVRQDLKDSGIGSGGHGFNYYFPKPIHDFFVHGNVEVRVKGFSHHLTHTADLMALLDEVRPLVAGPVANASDLKTNPDNNASKARAQDSPPTSNPPLPKVVTASPPPLPQPSHAQTSSEIKANPTSGAPGRGAILGVLNGHLVGWAVLEAKRTAVLVTVDGKVLAEASATGGTSAAARSGDPQMAAHGFEIPVPSAMLAGAMRRIALYDAATGTRIRDIAETIFFPKPEGRSQPPTAPAPVAKAPLAELKDVRPARSPAKIALPVPAVAPAAEPAKSGRVAVVAWDMAHNPVGRAFLLADLAAQGHHAELVGPTFAFYGGRLWPPIAKSTIPMQTFPATDLQSLVAGALELAANVKCDAVVVGKPRLSSLLIGALIRHANDCPMIIDIDDHELSFVQNHQPASFDELLEGLRDETNRPNIPYNDLWTRFAETLVGEADGKIVSNVALRHRFGGIIVRHARDERTFDPRLYDRAKIRAAFGYTDEDRVVLFLGTPRPHKGIFELADALERIDDPKLALCVIGTVTDKRTLARFATYKKARIALHPDQPWERLPELVSMADLAAILQDASHPIAEFQIPAKLTDSLALDVPVLATVVPPLMDLLQADVFEPVRDTDDLDAALRKLAASPPRGAGMGRGREAFLTEFSYAVNQARLDLVLETAEKNRKHEFPKFEQLFRLLEQRTSLQLPRLTDSPPRRDRRVPIRQSDKPRDLIFLWKQNDSDIYGRRSDMIAKYLLKTGRIRRVIHFDAPISAGDLERQAGQSDGDSAHQGNLIYVNTVRRILKTADTPHFARRTYLHRSGMKPERALGRELPSRDAYPDYVRKTLAELNVSDAPILWVSPIVFDYQMIADVARPAFIVADVIDDQRTFPGDSEAHRQRVSGAYATILGEADAVFSNCEPVRVAFSDLRPDIKMVPNGAELLADVTTWPAPPELAGLPRPIFGYVGNLRDRVDFSIIEAIAEKYPEGTVVLIGSAHGRPDVSAMAARWHNIKLLGVRPYEEAQRIMRGFDIALMPHLKTEQSDRMNPLKLYVYFSVGVPVVTTEVANIGDLAPYVNVAADKPAFLAAVADVLAGFGRSVSEPDRQRILSGLSWEKRVADIWAHLERVA